MVLIVYRDFKRYSKILKMHAIIYTGNITAIEYFLRLTNIARNHFLGKTIMCVILFIFIIITLN